jgi:hypothetical protein
MFVENPTTILAYATGASTRIEPPIKERLACTGPPEELLKPRTHVPKLRSFRARVFGERRRDFVKEQ